MSPGAGPRLLIRLCGNTLLSLWRCWPTLVHRPDSGQFGMPRRVLLVGPDCILRSHIGNTPRRVLGSFISGTKAGGITYQSVGSYSPGMTKVLAVSRPM